MSDTPGTSPATTTPPRTPAAISRRQFVAGATAAAASANLLTLQAPVWAQAAGGEDQLNLAIIGAGSQGRNLLLNCLKIPGVRFKAVCDIWDYHQKYAGNILKKFDQPSEVFESCEQLLAKKDELDLDAVIIATPDWAHAEQANACLKAGLHVYCEKEMSNSVEGAASMVRAAAETGKLLQIGHQRRSNPRYHLAKKLIENDRVCGMITHFYGQWNRRHRLELGWPEQYTIEPARLEKYGYANMDEFRNWRWYRQYSGGPIADLGSHQIDVFTWFLGANPASVIASGGLDYYTHKDRDWYDNIYTVYEYQTKQAGKPQTVRGNYQVLNSTSYGDYYETLMGDEGTLVISEDPKKGFYFKEPTSQRKLQWEDEAEKVEAMGRDAIQLKVGESLAPGSDADGGKSEILADVQKPVHQLHLENFFDAVRAGDKKKLTCPAEVGYETAVAVLAANDSVAKEAAVAFDAAAFEV